MTEFASRLRPVLFYSCNFNFLYFHRINLLILRLYFQISDFRLSTQKRFTALKQALFIPTVHIRILLRFRIQFFHSWPYNPILHPRFTAAAGFTPRFHGCERFCTPVSRLQPVSNPGFTPAAGSPANSGRDLYCIFYWISSMAIPFFSSRRRIYSSAR